MSKMGLILLLVAGVMTAASNLLLRAGLLRAGGFHPALNTLFSDGMRLLLQPLFSLGLIFYALAALVWMRVISAEPLSTAYPLLVSFTFVLITACAAYFFNESVSLMKFIGLAVIVLGIFLVSKGG